MGKRQEAQKWVKGYTSVGVAIVVAAIVPGSTTIALIAVEATMVSHIGGIYRGTDISMEEAAAIAGRIGLACIVGQIGTLEFLNTLPVFGWAAKAAIAGTIIITLGDSIIDYFEEQDDEKRRSQNRRSDQGEERAHWRGSTSDHNILVKNFLQLKQELDNSSNDFRIAVIGQPGAGKSSLIRTISKKKCRPLPKIGQETDATDWSSERVSEFFNVYKRLRFVDTPGYNTSKHPAEVFESYFPFDQFDYIIHVLKDKVHEADRRVAQRVSHNKTKYILVRCFAEEIEHSERDRIERDYFSCMEINKAHLKSSFRKVFFASNRNCEGVEELQEIFDANANT